MLFPLLRQSAGIMEWCGAMQNIKFYAPNLRVSGVRCQEEKQKKTET
jgi:hypothetical protein